MMDLAVPKPRLQRSSVVPLFANCNSSKLRQHGGWIAQGHAGRCRGGGWIEGHGSSSAPHWSAAPRHEHVRGRTCSRCRPTLEPAARELKGMDRHGCPTLGRRTGATRAAAPPDAMQRDRTPRGGGTAQQAVQVGESGSWWPRGLPVPAAFRPQPSGLDLGRPSDPSRVSFKLREYYDGGGVSLPACEP